MNQYKKHFDHLGQMRAGDFMPWTTAEKAIAVCLLVTVFSLMTGVFK